ncbi:MAG: hypothetical protein JWL66_224 [Sphingomonadales bacterium]|jgi:hypothetical protein|nr:hypothetical protein [Sphingomonadales bacterium]
MDSYSVSDAKAYHSELVGRVEAGEMSRSFPSPRPARCQVVLSPEE